MAGLGIASIARTRLPETKSPKFEGSLSRQQQQPKMVVDTFERSPTNVIVVTPLDASKSNKLLSASDVVKPFFGAIASLVGVAAAPKVLSTAANMMGRLVNNTQLKAFMELLAKF